MLTDAEALRNLRNRIPSLRDLAPGIALKILMLFTPQNWEEGVYKSRSYSGLSPKRKRCGNAT
jgi:hypothetical protein